MLVLAAVLFFTPAISNDNSPNKNVLCIISYSADYQWANDILNGLRRNLQLSDLAAAIELFEQMSARSRTPGPAQAISPVSRPAWTAIAMTRSWCFPTRHWNFSCRGN